MRPALRAALCGIGILPTFPRAVVHGPRCLQGLGVPFLYNTQGIHKLLKILNYSNSPTSTSGRLLKVTMENQHLESGLSGNSLTPPLSILPCLTPTWLKFSSSFFVKHGWSIARPTLSIPTAFSQDHYLMDEFAKLPGPPLPLLNDCHVHLHLLTIGDTLDASGQYILPGYTNGTLVCPSHPFH